MITLTMTESACLHMCAFCKKTNKNFCKDGCRKFSWLLKRCNSSSYIQYMFFLSRINQQVLMNKLHKDLVKQNWKPFQTAFLVLVQVESDEWPVLHILMDCSCVKIKPEGEAQFKRGKNSISIFQIDWGCALIFLLIFNS